MFVFVFVLSCGKLGEFDGMGDLKVETGEIGEIELELELELGDCVVGMGE